MKKTVILIVMAVCIAMAVGSALAVPPGKTLDYAGGAMGKVTFDGKTHGDAGNKCNDCHTKIFQMKMGSAKITAADHEPGKFCGSCHDGTKCHIK